MSINSPRFNAGALRHYAELQSQVKVSDGMGGQSVTWEKVRDIYCRIKPVSGVQRMESMRRASPISHEITTRYNPDIDTQKRFVYRGNAYRIEAEWDVDERHEFMHTVASAQRLSDVST